MNKRNMIYVLFIFITLFCFNITVKADYKATVLITDGAKCELRATSTGKCLYSNTNFNSYVPGVVWLDTGDIVTVIEGEKYPSKDKSRCDTEYVKVNYSFQNNPSKVYTGYFCNSNLKRDGDVEESYIEEFRNAGFPESYFSKLSILKQAHPNWTFKAINTDIDFNYAVSRENVLGNSLLEVVDGYNNVGYLNTWSGSYNYYNDTFNAFDGSTWYQANDKTIAYYMDPRNFLIDMYIFQFEALSYEKDLQKLEVVQKLLNGDYLNNYSSSFITAASESNVSPVYLASLSKQEVGGRSYATTAVSGKAFTYNGNSYSGIYNPYNIGATSGTNPVYNGLYWATGSGYTQTSYDRPWTSMDKAIRGGAKWIGKNYINVGQNTIYFKKWDVVGNDGYFSHQYQTNIQAPMIEGNSVYKSYNDSNILNSSFVFYIPVYKNMPAETSLPNTGNPNNYLKSLSINGENISSFDGGVTNYNYYVKSNIDSITIAASLVNNSAKVSGTGYVSLTSDNTKVEIKVTAQNGDERVYTINVIREPKTEDTTADDKISVMEALNNANIKNNDLYLMGFSINSNISQIKNKLGSSASVTIKDNNGNTVTEGIIKTGYSVTIKTNSEEKTLKTILYGDVNGDGKITAVDYAKVKNYVLGSISLSADQIEASDTNHSKSVTAADYGKLKNVVLGKSTIEQ